MIKKMYLYKLMNMRIWKHIVCVLMKTARKTETLPIQYYFIDGFALLN